MRAEEEERIRRWYFYRTDNPLICFYQKERIGSIRKTVYEEQIREAVKVQLNLRGRDCAEEKRKKVHHDKRSLGQKALTALEKK